MLLWKAFYPLSGGYNLNRVQWTLRDFDMFGTRMSSCCAPAPSCGAFRSFPVFYALLHSFVPGLRLSGSALCPPGLSLPSV